MGDLMQMYALRSSNNGILAPLVVYVALAQVTYCMGLYSTSFTLAVLDCVFGPRRYHTNFPLMMDSLPIPRASVGGLPLEAVKLLSF